MLPPTPLPLRPKPREWLITACVISLVALAVWPAISYLREPRYSAGFAAGLRNLDEKKERDARPALDRALAADPDNAELYRVICEHAAKARQWSVAIDYARRGLQKFPKAPLETRLVLYAELATSLTEGKPAGWQEETLEASRLAYELASDNPVFQNLYGYNLADLRDDPDSLKQAETLLTAALQTLGKAEDTPAVRELRAVTQNSYGWMRCKQGDYAAAAAACREAISGLIALDTLDDSAKSEPLKTTYYHLGMALRGKGDVPAARKALERALDFDANYMEAKAALAALPPS